MNNAPVQTLLDAVRRCLWQARLMVALRFALWATAGMMLVVVAVHLALVPVSFASLALALAALWTGALAWAAGQRPGAPACALWADRHLGGASAFSTLLETNAGTVTNAQALRWLEDWTSARVPDAMQLLAQRTASPRLARPLSSMVVGLALAGVVLQLPGPAPSPPPTTVAAAPSAVASLPVVAAEAPAALVSEISRALRATEASGASGAFGASKRRQTEAASTAGPGQPDAGRNPSQSQLGQARETSPAAQPAIPPVHAQAASGATSADTASTGAARASLAPDAGGGREAGDSRDGAAGMGVTRVLQAPLAVQRSDAAIRQSSARSQADMDRPAAYDEERSTPAAAAAHPGAAPAAAAAPAATEAARLTPTETSYVQAWMRASVPHR